MKKPFMKKEDLEKEYINVPADKTCHVPLIQATKLLGIKKEDLPTIRTPASDLHETFEWLMAEKEKGLFIYNRHIEHTKDRLIETYPEIKVKLHKQFKPKHSAYNPSDKSEEVCRFIDNAIILELDHMIDGLDDRPPFLDAFLSEERTLH